jgi:hypothetical protein
VTAQFDFAAAAGVAEQRLANALSLRPMALPPELAAMHGRWKGHPVALRASAWRGARVRYARTVCIAGEGLSIVNMLALSEPDYPLPILGVDLVAAGAPAAVIVADLSPIADDPTVRHRQNAALASRVSTRPELPSARTLPSWCRPWFSPRALFARITAVDDVDVGIRIGDYVDTFAALAADSRPDPAGAGHIEARQQAYCAAHLSDDRGLQLTRKMFDPALADRVLSEILFPVRGVTCQ